MTIIIIFSFFSVTDLTLPSLSDGCGDSAVATPDRCAVFVLDSGEGRSFWLKG
jgi:hypothetical protein